MHKALFPEDFYSGATGHFGQGGSADPYARVEVIACIDVGDHELGLGIDRGQRMAAVPPWNNDIRGYRNNKTQDRRERRKPWQLVQLGHRCERIPRRDRYSDRLRAHFGGDQEVSMRRPINDVAVIVSCISLLWSIWILVMMNIAESRFGSMPDDEFMTPLKHFGTAGFVLLLCAAAVLWFGAARFLVVHWAELGSWARVIWVYCMLFGPAITPFVCFPMQPRRVF